MVGDRVGRSDGSDGPGVGSASARCVEECTTMSCEESVWWLFESSMGECICDDGGPRSTSEDDIRGRMSCCDSGARGEIKW